MNLPDAENFGDVPDPEGATAVEKAGNLAASLMRIARIILAAVGIGLIVMYGFILVITGHNEESVGKQKKALLWAIVGFALLSVAATVGDIFNFGQGSFVGSGELIMERAGIFNDTVTTIVTFLKYVLGSVAVFMIVQSAFTMITAGDKEEAITNERKQVIGAVAGIVIILVAEFFVRRVLFKIDPDAGYDTAMVTIDTRAGLTEIVAVTNFLVSFVGPVMILGIVGGGLMYALSGGDEEKSGKAKKIIVNSIIGAIIIYGAFAIVSTVISGVI